MSNPIFITDGLTIQDRFNAYDDNLMQLSNTELLLLHTFINSEGGWLDESMSEKASIRAEMKRRAEDMMGYVEGQIREDQND